MMRENMELLRELGVHETEVRSFGGGARSEVWSQIKSDICNVQIKTMSQSESASLGAAMLAAVAIGWFDSLETAGRQNDIVSIIEPQKENSVEYDAIYQKYLMVLKQTKDLF